MQFETTEPYDLYGAIVYTLVTVAVVFTDPWAPLRVVLGLGFVLFLPGYVLVAALFPERHRRFEREAREDEGEAEVVEEGIDGLERVALSLGLSIAVVPLIGLGLNSTPWGIRLYPVLIALVVFTLSGCMIARIRRRQIPHPEKLAFNFLSKPGSWAEYSPSIRLLTIGLAASILLSAGAIGHALWTPHEADRFTEFYLLGPDGRLNDYPTNLTVNETGALIVGVTNQEHQPMNYSIDAVHQLGSFQKGPDNRTFRPTENTSINNWTVELNHMQKWNETIPFDFDVDGYHRFLFRLNSDNRGQQPYRELAMFIRVEGE